jgi:hypothetical protein
VKHGNYQKAPMNKISDELKIKTQNLVRDKYFDFNMLHCLEKLSENEQLQLKRETFRKWCHEIKMVKRAKKRRAKPRYTRHRMQRTGLMLQMDGSPHRWFANQTSCLIAAIDDANNEVPYAEFFHSEDVISCMRLLQKIIEKKGLFEILYVDHAGVYGGTKRTDFSQVKRALAELGIHVIFANSPQAKGRIERLFGTLQDRLIPELRFRNIRSFKGANSFLQEHYLPNEYDRKFKIAPENLQSAYKPLPKGISLKEIFCIKEYRLLNKAHTFSWHGGTFQVRSPLKYSIHHQKIELRTYQDLTWKAFFAGKEIKIIAASKKLKLAS